MSMPTAWQRQQSFYFYTEPKFIVMLWALKPAATAWDRHWGWPMPMFHEMSIQRHKVSSHPLPAPFQYFVSHKKPVMKITRKIQMCSTNRRDLPHSTPFPLLWGWKAEYEVDYEIRWVKVNSSIWSHTLCFSLNTASASPPDKYSVLLAIFTRVLLANLVSAAVSCFFLPLSLQLLKFQLV